MPQLKGPKRGECNSLSNFAGQQPNILTTGFCPSSLAIAQYFQFFFCLAGVAKAQGEFLTSKFDETPYSLAGGKDLSMAEKGS